MFVDVTFLGTIGTIQQASKVVDTALIESARYVGTVARISAETGKAMEQLPERAVDNFE